MSKIQIQYVTTDGKTHDNKDKAVCVQARLDLEELLVGKLPGLRLAIRALLAEFEANPKNYAELLYIMGLDFTNES